jgi:serine/threonine-protein kinase
MTEFPHAIARVSAALSDRYRIERELGRGGMATVYLAEDTKHHRRVAVKVLHPELAAGLGPERFLREVQISAGLQHPHILTLIDSGEGRGPSDGPGGGFLYYVMPFVDGESLRARIAREREMPIADVVRIVREVADALSEAHAHGVVHRDVKPDNVLLRGQHAVVTDFGIAKAVTEATGRHDLTTVGVTLGTPTYMAPEQAAGDPAIDHRADIYALGVMAYEMLTGQPPFTGATPQSVLSAHMTQAPVPLTARRAAVPGPLASVIMRSLVKNPADPWASANDLVAQLDAVVTPVGSVPLAEPAASSAASRRASRRNAVLALVAGLAIVAAATYAFRARSSSPGAVENTRTPMVVVLPFENLGTPNDEYFADGMTAELTGRLTKLPGLAVIARSSANQYKKTTKTTAQIAKELGVDFLVEGTVRWERTADGVGRVRVASEVIRATDGTHVWADRFDKPYGTDIFAIQSDIAEQVARAMDVTLRPSDQRVVRAVPTTNLAAYDAYLRARSDLDRDFGQNWEEVGRASESLEQAVRLDSGFAAAHALLASVHVKKILGGYDISLGTGVTTERRWEMARAAAERALVVDSLTPGAHAVLATYYGAVVGDTARQRANLEAALRGDPNSPELMTALGLIVRNAGTGTANTGEEGLRALEQSVRLDPRNAVRWWTLARFHNSFGNDRAAKIALDRAIAITPTEPTMYLAAAWLHLKYDRPDSARAVLRQAIAQAGVNSVLFRMAQHSSWIDMVRILHDDLGPPAARLTLKEFGTDSIDYYEIKQRVYRLEPARSRAYSDSIVRWAAPRAGLETRDPTYRLELAFGLAGAGQRDRAMRALQPFSDGGDGQVVGLNLLKLAYTTVMIGDFDRAVSYIVRLLGDSTLEFSPAILRLDPIWDPLRNRPDFKKLAERH